MSDRREPVPPPAPPRLAPAEAQAARLKQFQREQLIVEYLNRGVSVAEIAARVGVGEKRLTRDCGNSRPLHAAPAGEFVAIQLSRLNEALLVAYSAMSPLNLKAVDQVVKIVRELDRYGGAFAAEWPPPERAGARRARRSGRGLRAGVALRRRACARGRRPSLARPRGRRAPAKSGTKP